MYCVRKIMVDENDSLFGYCYDICTKARKLYNAARVAELKSILDGGVDNDGDRLTVSQRKNIQHRVDRI